MNVFDPEEIIITQKDYPAIHHLLDFKNEDIPLIEYELAQLLDRTIPFTDETGNYWKIDDNDSSYRSAFLKGLDI